MFFHNCKGTEIATTHDSFAEIFGNLNLRVMMEEKGIKANDSFPNLILHFLVTENGT